MWTVRCSPVPSACAKWSKPQALRWGAWWAAEARDRGGQAVASPTGPTCADVGGTREDDVCSARTARVDLP